MKATDIPASKFPLAFAASGSKQTIPEASQIGIVDGRASLTDGFPPLTRTPIAAGGVPPFGTDMNGILYMISAWTRWFNAGGQVKFDSSFSADTNVNGYPAGAVVARSDGAGFWLNLTDDNTTNPDAAGSANWAPLEAYGIASVTGLTTGAVTLTPAQYGLPILILAGTLTGNVQVIFPATKNQWLVINNTTGNFSVTAKTGSGSGVIVGQGLGANVYGDGTNIVAPALQTPSATLASQPVQFGQVAGVVGSMRNGKASLAAASASITFTFDEVVVETALGGLRYCLANFSQTVSTSTTGIGGVVGAALTASGYAAVYAAYNPSTGQQGAFIVNANSLVPNIAAAPPAGWVATALVSVWPLNASTQFAAGAQRDRRVMVSTPGGFSTNTPQSSFTSIALTGVPANAVKAQGNLSALSTSANATIIFTVATDALGTGQKSNVCTTVTASNGNSAPVEIDIITPQTLYYRMPTPVGTPTASLVASSYEF
ncbi:hypothetical protein [Pandoraea sputorum]|uniref:Tail fiber protein n=1 Tax=Pandoraea sputorum TaxID=93222 RepID=A0A5E5B9A1_9BURK|nr:hypothetical protein [Pandoraea sputorum]VVE82821.1 hypothetical protein PSP31121_03984 [Pandoraea sputorum]